MLKRHKNGKRKTQIATTDLWQVKLSKKYNIYYQNYLINLASVGKIQTNVADRLGTTKLFTDVRACSFSEKVSK